MVRLHRDVQCLVVPVMRIILPSGSQQRCLSQGCNAGKPKVGDVYTALEDYSNPNTEGYATVEKGHTISILSNDTAPGDSGDTHERRTHVCPKHGHWVPWMGSHTFVPFPRRTPKVIGENLAGARPGPQVSEIIIIGFPGSIYPSNQVLGILHSRTL